MGHWNIRRELFYAQKLDQFLYEFSDPDSTVSVTSVANVIMRLKPKLSRGIDRIRVLHVKNGGPALLEYLTLLIQMIFTQGLVLSTFCVGDLSPVPKKNEKHTINAHLSGP